MPTALPLAAIEVTRAAGAHWVHDLSPFLLQFTETFGIRYYGLAYVLGFAAGWFLLWLYWRRGRSPLAPEAQADLIFAIVIGTLLGGRLGYFLLYRFDQFAADPLILIRVWEGGMASHGGFVGVIAALWWAARRHRVDFWRVADIVATLAPPGLLLGRIANFINGELWGKVTDVSWAVIFSNTGGGPEPRHPSQLYHAFGEGLVALLYTQWRFWRGPARTTPGQLGGEFLIVYAVARMICEVFREPDAGLILGLSRGTFYSVFLLVAGAVIIVFARVRAARAASGGTGKR